VAPRLAVVPALDEELDRLYGLPLDEFTAARNELATRLKKAGQDDASASVRGLKKPSVPVWIVNQLARQHPDEVHALVETGRRLRSAQQDALRGRGSEALRQAAAEERDAVRRLTAEADRLLKENGRPATQQTIERVAQTLRAAAVEPGAADLLGAGRLADEVESAGFDAIAAIAPPPRRGAKKSKRTAPSAAERRQLERERRSLETRVGRLEHAADQATREAERAQQAADDSRARADQAHAELDAARQELARLERF